MAVNGDGSILLDVIAELYAWRYAEDFGERQEPVPLFADRIVGLILQQYNRRYPMPVLSKAQNRAMRAAAAGRSTLGIPKSVAKEFVAASHGKSLSNLPARKAKPKKR